MGGPDSAHGGPESGDEAFEVGVAGLGYYCFYGGRVLQGETKEDGSAVVEDVGGVGGYVEGGEEFRDGVGEGGEGEAVVGGRGC